jgi:CubicO group peptidase (beta-lactamase class C family)
VEAFVDGAVLSAMHKDHIAGVSVAIVCGRDVLLAKGYGLAAPGMPADADTLFRVGSISKTGTWIAIMQLVEKGKLKLDNPINAHLPAQLLVPDEGFNEPILIKNLMSHNAGFEDSVLGHIITLDPNKVLPQEAYLARYRVHRMRPPGQLAVYSNYGAGLAGMIVAHESGEDWPTYAERHILRPLGMTSATYRDPLPVEIVKAHHLATPMPPELAARVTQGWRFENGVLAVQPYEYVSQDASASALAMSANDAAAYMMSLLDPQAMERAGVLKASTFLKVREPLFANYPGIGAIRHGFFTYDLGGGRWAFGHDGALLSHFSRQEVSPALNVGVFVSVNTQGVGAALADTFPHAFFHEFFPSSPTKIAPVPPTAQQMAQRYEGSYRALRRSYYRTEAGLQTLLSTTTVTALPDGDLLAAGPLGPSTRLHALGSGVFGIAGGDGKAAFAERNGRTMLFDAYGIGPSERVEYFESLNWLLPILFLGLFIAVWGTASGIRRTLMGNETQVAFLLDGLCLIWLIGLGTLLLALAPALADPVDAMTSYPTGILVTSCWLMLIAAIATLVVPIAALFVVRPRWSWFHWARVSLGLLVFFALALTLWRQHLLGFWGWD